MMAIIVVMMTMMTIIVMMKTLLIMMMIDDTCRSFLKLSAEEGRYDTVISSPTFTLG